MTFASHSGSITQFIAQFRYAIPLHKTIMQLIYSEILKITRLRNDGNYAEIHQNYAMGNLLIMMGFKYIPPAAGSRIEKRRINVAIMMTVSPLHGR